MEVSCTVNPLKVGLTVVYKKSCNCKQCPYLNLIDCTVILPPTFCNRLLCRSRCWCTSNPWPSPPAALETIRTLIPIACITRDGIEHCEKYRWRHQHEKIQSTSQKLMHWSSGSITISVNHRFEPYMFCLINGSGIWKSFYADLHMAYHHIF